MRRPGSGGMGVRCAAVAVVAGVAMALAACGGDDDGAPPPTDGASSNSTSAPAPTGSTPDAPGPTGSASTAPTGTDEPGTTPPTSHGRDTTAGFSIASSLAEIPAAVVDRDSPIQLVVGDLDRATEIAGLTRPDSIDGDAMFDWIGPLTGVSGPDGPPPVAVVPPEVVDVQQASLIEEFADEVGWSLLDVRTYVELQQPPQVVSVLTGDFDESRIGAAQGDRTTDGVWSLGGADFEVSAADRTPARPLGGSLRTALVGDHLAVARSTDAVLAWLDDAGETLADDAPLAAAAAALDDADAYAALLLTDDTATGDVADDHADDDDRLLPFDALGVGSAADDDGAVVVLTYAHGSDDDAATNAERLRTMFTNGSSTVSQQPWSELLELDDVVEDGPVVTVTLHVAEGGNPMIGYRAVFQRDSFTVAG